MSTKETNFASWWWGETKPRSLFTAGQILELCRERAPSPTTAAAKTKDSGNTTEEHLHQTVTLKYHRLTNLAA